MALRSFDPEALEQLERKYWGDLKNYAHENLKIVTKAAGLVPFDFNGAQELVHERLAKQRRETGRIRAIFLKARQLGMSTYVAARFFRAINMRPRLRGLVMADEVPRAGELFMVYERFERELPDWIRPRRKYAVKRTEMTFDARVYGLGSMITVKTARDKMAGRAVTLHLVHMSEVGFWNNASETFTSVMGAVPDLDSEVIIESTANGIGGLLYEMWQTAEAGENEWLAIFLPWWIDPGYTKTPLVDSERDEILGTLTEYERAAMEEGYDWEGRRWKLSVEQIAWRRDTIRDRFQGDERRFRQEFPATPREAFLVSGTGFFDEQALLKYENASRDPIFRGELESIAGRGLVLRPKEMGWLQVYEMPRADGAYVIGADTAEGRNAAARATSFDDPEGYRGGRDFNSAHVFDAKLRRFVATLHMRSEPDVFASYLQRLGYFYSATAPGKKRPPALIGVENNHSSGQSTIRWLKDHGYPRLFYTHTINRRAGEIETAEAVAGWNTNRQTRRPMLDELAAALRDDDVWLPDKRTIRELFTFVMDDAGKPQAQEEAHDDCVISAAIALQMARHTWTAPAKPLPPEPPVGEGPTGWGAPDPATFDVPAAFVPEDAFYGPGSTGYFD